MATSFEVLGIPNGASEEEIKVAFRLKIKEVYFRDRKCAEELIAAMRPSGRREPEILFPPSPESSLPFSFKSKHALGAQMTTTKI
jgi:hypothetical protein